MRGSSPTTSTGRCEVAAVGAGRCRENLDADKERLGIEVVEGKREELDRKAMNDGMAEGRSVAYSINPVFPRYRHVARV
ncbi:hypothetical protein ASPBRDRAFT_74658 [Aspergillus brasiliensis CBS 101740]|uniref:Uncharacterized protein n=1 Tax=Aspergillus brasiliensis (strain CBS 101740 / IMI 381727 / IBT 21946) TaxID=767769 RepID=A0A1L9UM27_ASPBC|nr:hypothetical protein ASPBRDRAFT_74658 [Aspergillus brasiliensis CBS 101740]